MSRAWRTAAAAVILLAACRQSPPPATEQPLIVPEGENLLSMTRGAAVVDRTGEQGLSYSAIQAIDSDPLTVWVTPPADLDETMTIALAGEAVIRRVGGAAGERGMRNLPPSLRFEASVDGQTFAPLATVTLKPAGESWAEVQPVTVRYLRVSTVPGEARLPHFRVPTVLASGSLRPAPRPSIDGGWVINGVDAWFETRGEAVRGVTRETPPRLLEGAWEGPLLRVAWSRGNEHGVAALTVDPTGQHLNAAVWYLWAHRPFLGQSWFGRRTAAVAEPPSTGTPPQSVFLRSDGRYPLYGLSFDGEQLTPHSRRAVEELASVIGRAEPGRLRLVAHHVGTGSAESDQRFAAARLEALRVALREAGVDPSHVEFAAAGHAAAASANDRPWSPVQVALNNRVDLEIASPAGKRR